MITIKSDSEIALMREAGKILRDTLNLLGEHVKVGVTTKELDKLAHDYIISRGAKPSFLGYGGFPGSICASVNEQVVHGIPSNRKLVAGDIIGIDCGVIYKGWQSDAARTFAVGEISEKHKKLIEVTEQCFFEAMKVIKEGARLGDIGSAVQNLAESNGFSVVRDLVGHGIGKEMHEDPQVPNYGKAGKGLRLKRNMTLAIEPMINEGTYEVSALDDGWTVVTDDNGYSAHYENTVLITEDGYEILSL
ncbi:MAG: type I methionyl aminopeptidase [Clostridia bacterium]|nr:type I methionyl aminopeptidase [Clostridia bacterium]